MKALQMFILVSVLLTSCGNSFTATPNATPLPTQTVSPKYTASPTFTHLPTNAPEPTITQSPTADPNLHPVFQAGSLASGYDMGVNSSGGLTNWVTVNRGEMCMAYPSGQGWGAVFITVGKPKDHPRPGEDLSEFKKLSIELRGDKGNETILVGVKDNTQPDDGSETKFRIKNLRTSWTVMEIPLAEFKRADLSKLYVVSEFVFENTPETICARNIAYLK